MEKLLLSVAEACQASGLGRSKFLELVYQGEIPSFIVGRRRLIHADALREWAKSLSTQRTADGKVLLYRRGQREQERRS